MKVFMTGANGFVGLNVVKALVKNGHDVQAYVRENSNTSFLEPLGVTLHRGSLDDKEKLAEAMKDCEAVIHTAGNTSCRNKDLPVLRKVNVEGTQNIVDAALKNKVKRIVYTSTTSTVGGYNHREKKANESTPLEGFRAKSPYARTKLEAEKIILDAQEKGLECVILNLAEVIGAFDHNLQWGRMVLAVYHNQVPFIPPGGGSFCSAAKCGEAHVDALTKGKSGERYIIAGEDKDYNTFINAISEITGKSFDIPKKSYTWLRTKATLQENLPAIVPGKPLVEPYRMRVFGGHYYFDSSKANNELGYEKSTLKEMLEECVDWYKENGFLA